MLVFFRVYFFRMERSTKEKNGIKEGFCGFARVRAFLNVALLPSRSITLEFLVVVIYSLSFSVHDL